MKNIRVITTGGTIAMKYDATSKGLIPAVTGEDLIEAVPALTGICNLEVSEFSNVPSGHITPEMMFQLAKKVDFYAENDDVDGIVITHGTDTMEETAYMLSLVCKTKKPVVLTGAMRGASDMGYDGPGNILAAVKTAADSEARGRDALLVLNDEIHAAAEVTKTNTVSCSTFKSLGWGPIGHVYYDRVVFKRRSENLQKIDTDCIETNVELLKVSAGMSKLFFECAANKPVAGLVVEALGCGNVPPDVMDGIKYVRQKGIPVVLASRVGSGRVVPMYGYVGSAGYMAPLDLILSGDINVQKSRIKLMVALGKCREIQQLRQIFEDCN